MEESLLEALKAGVALPLGRLEKDFKLHGGELQGDPLTWCGLVTSKLQGGGCAVCVSSS